MCGEHDREPASAYKSRLDLYDRVNRALNRL
jgi:hypothetical protein